MDFLQGLLTMLQGLPLWGLVLMLIVLVLLVAIPLGLWQARQHRIIIEPEEPIDQPMDLNQLEMWLRMQTANMRALRRGWLLSFRERSRAIRDSLRTRMSRSWRILRVAARRRMLRGLKAAWRWSRQEPHEYYTLRDAASWFKANALPRLKAAGSSVARWTKDSAWPWLKARMVRMRGGTLPAPAPSRKKLADLTPADIRRIGARYGLYITGKVGTSFWRLAWLAAYIVAALYLARFASRFGLDLVGLDGVFAAGLLTLALWSLAIGWGLMEWFIVSVPKLTGLITTNYFTKEQHVYDVGWSIKYPWESYTLTDYIDMQADIGEKIGPDGKPMQSTFITKGRIPISFPWNAQFRPWLPLLPVYVSTENKAIQQGLEEVVESIISFTVTDKEVDKIMEPDTLRELHQNLAKALEGEEVGRAQVVDEEGSTIEQRFGINIELVTFSPPTYAKDYQEAMTASKVLAVALDDAEKLKRLGGISGKEAFDRVLVANKESAEIKVTSFEASQNIVDAVKEVGVWIAGAIAGRVPPASSQAPAPNQAGGAS